MRIFLKANCKDNWKLTANGARSTYQLVIALHSIYGLQIHRNLYGSQRYYNESLLFAHQQVAYEL